MSVRENILPMLMAPAPPQAITSWATQSALVIFCGAVELTGGAGQSSLVPLVMLAQAALEQSVVTQAFESTSAYFNLPWVSDCFMKGDFKEAN